MRLEAESSRKGHEMQCAKHVMQTGVISVGIHDSLISAHRTFMSEEISGAPVVDEVGHIVGVLTLRDLMREGQLDDEGFDQRLEYYREGETRMLYETDFGESPVAEQLIRRTVADAMNPGVVSVHPDDTVSLVVEKLLENRIHRVIVVEPGEVGDTLVGIISLFDLIALLA